MVAFAEVVLSTCQGNIELSEIGVVYSMNNVSFIEESNCYFPGEDGGHSNFIFSKEIDFKCPQGDYLLTQEYIVSDKLVLFILMIDGDLHCVLGDISTDSKTAHSETARSKAYYFSKLTDFVTAKNLLKRNSIYKKLLSVSKHVIDK